MTNRIPLRQRIFSVVPETKVALCQGRSYLLSWRPERSQVLRHMSESHVLIAPVHASTSQTAAVDNLVELAGWGANLRSRCKLVEPEVPAELRKFLSHRMIARGLGRSYGDPALNAGGLVVGMRKLDRFLDFDENTGILNCEAGVSLLQIIHYFGPRGYFPMISPGTQYVTIGGCIANDIHGKAHHSQGSFANSVESMRVLLANGEVVTCSRSQLPDLFWASFGGMGLLGIILSAEIKLRRVETNNQRELVPVDTLLYQNQQNNGPSLMDIMALL